MSDVCLDFEDLLVEIKKKYIDKKDQISEKLWYAANAAYAKLTKYYTKISSRNFAIATVLDPRYKLDVYDSTDDPEALKASAKSAIETAFSEYWAKVPKKTDNSNQQPVLSERYKKKQKRFANVEAPPDEELRVYLNEKRVGAEADPLQYW